MLLNQILSKQFNQLRQLKKLNQLKQLKQYAKYSTALISNEQIDTKQTDSKQTDSKQTDPSNDKSKCTHHHINCSNCRLYIESEKSCKLYPINKLSNKKQLSIDARINESECGIDGKNFWQIDATFKKKYEKAEQLSSQCISCAIIAPIFGLYYFPFILSSPLLMFISFMFNDVAKKYKEQYNHDNGF